MVDDGGDLSADQAHTPPVGAGFEPAPIETRP